MRYVLSAGNMVPLELGKPKAISPEPPRVGWVAISFEALESKVCLSGAKT